MKICIIEIPGLCMIVDFLVLTSGATRLNEIISTPCFTIVKHTILDAMMCDPTTIIKPFQFLASSAFSPIIIQRMFRIVKTLAVKAIHIWDCCRGGEKY